MCGIGYLSMQSCVLRVALNSPYSLTVPSGQQRAAQLVLGTEPWMMSTVILGYHGQFSHRVPVTTTPAPMRLWGLRILNYLDDWLVCAVSEQQSCSHVVLLLEHVQPVGWLLNYQKSKLHPSQVTTFLGMTLDSNRATQTLARPLQATLLGQLGNVPLPHGLHGMMVDGGRYTCNMFSNAFWAWAFAHSSLIRQGFWCHRGSTELSTFEGILNLEQGYVELMALFLALQQFLLRLGGYHVIINTDSTVTTVTAAYINRKGA